MQALSISVRASRTDFRFKTYINSDMSNKLQI